MRLNVREKTGRKALWTKKEKGKKETVILHKHLNIFGWPKSVQSLKILECLFVEWEEEKQLMSVVARQLFCSKTVFQRM